MTFYYFYHHAVLLRGEIREAHFLSQKYLQEVTLETFFFQIHNSGLKIEIRDSLFKLIKFEAYETNSDGAADTRAVKGCKHKKDQDGDILQNLII